MELQPNRLLRLEITALTAVIEIKVHSNHQQVGFEIAGNLGI